MAGDFTDQVLNEMTARRDARQAASEERRRRMRVACPDLKAMDIMIAKAARADKDALRQLECRRRETAERWLQEQGLPAGWLDVPADCPLCGDTGFLDGRLCTCVRNEVARRMHSAAGLGGNSPTFERFDLTLFPDTVMTKHGCSVRGYMEFLRDMGLSYVARFPNVQKPNLLFTGPTGCGKTYLLDSIASALIGRGFWVVRVTAFGVNDIMAKAMFEKANPDHLFECDLLALDDLGSEPLLNKVTVNSLFNLLNERLAAGKPFIISTNLTPGEVLRRYDERIFSRMTDQRTTRIFEFEGVDLRRGSPI